MAHDLRTPLVTIIGVNENLELQYPDDPFIQNVLKLSSSSCHYMIQTFEQVQELSKIQLGSFKLLNKDFDVR
jgi:signal transduction histidine kinase